jgi:Rrf2 family protein
MRLSKRGEYGLRAMISLAKNTSLNGNLSLMQIKDISAREKIPAKFLEQILLSLKNSGLLHSKMGIGGGYYLARDPQQIFLGQVIRVLDGPIAPIGCVSHSAYETCNCPEVETCGLRLVMEDVRKSISTILDNTSLADVVLRESNLLVQLELENI